MSQLLQPIKTTVKIRARGQNKTKIQWRKISDKDNDKMIINTSVKYL